MKLLKIQNKFIEGKPCKNSIVKGRSNTGKTGRNGTGSSIPGAIQKLALGFRPRGSGSVHDRWQECVR